MPGGIGVKRTTRWVVRSQFAKSYARADRAKRDFELPSCSFGDCCVAVTPDICMRVDVEGLEPSASKLRVSCSTN